jgi:hypothetical protein
MPPPLPTPLFPAYLCRVFAICLVFPVSVLPFLSFFCMQPFIGCYFPAALRPCARRCATACRPFPTPLSQNCILLAPLPLRSARLSYPCNFEKYSSNDKEMAWVGWGGGSAAVARRRGQGLLPRAGQWHCMPPDCTFSRFTRIVSARLCAHLKCGRNCGRDADLATSQGTRHKPTASIACTVYPPTISYLLQHCHIDECWLPPSRTPGRPPRFECALSGSWCGRLRRWSWFNGANGAKHHRILSVVIACCERQLCKVGGQPPSAAPPPLPRPAPPAVLRGGHVV